MTLRILLPSSQNITTQSKYYNTVKILQHSQNITTQSKYYNTVKISQHSQNITKQSTYHIHYMAIPKYPATLASNQARCTRYNFM
jgi:hypothetical protein